MREELYDIVVLGGALAGSSVALLLARERPAAKILVVEATDRFTRKVGEATVEVSGYFLASTLGLADHLESEHLPKHGLRYWFADHSGLSLRGMTEVGPSSTPRVPAYQLDRAILDEEVARRAGVAGAEIARPAKVERLELDWPESRVVISSRGALRTVRARWVVDGTGRHAFVARRLRLLKRLTEHRTAAMWARWEGVGDPDDLKSSCGSPALVPLDARRRLATNHFCGYGWWCWMIPLACGQTSIGLVWDRRLFEPSAAESRRAQYIGFLTAQPGLRDLLDGARLEEDDFHFYGNLAYRSQRYAGPGWALVGDAAAFLDPYFSPGLDHLSISVSATVRLLASELGGELDQSSLEAAIELHNERFERSYGRWYRALYQDKYEIFGDAELTAASFLLETAVYYLGVVSPVYRDAASLQNPVLGLEGRSSDVAYALLRTINRRMCKLARFRRQTGSYGRRNAGWRLYPPAFELGWRACRQLLMGLRLWASAELGRLWHRVVRGSVDLSRPVGHDPPI